MTTFKNSLCKLLLLMFCGTLLLLPFGVKAEETKVYDQQWRLKYRIENGRVYDSQWRLKYRVENGRVYDRQWRLKYRIEKTREPDSKWKRIRIQ